MQIEIDCTRTRRKWLMGAGESHPFGSASLAETLEVGATQATRIGGRHCDEPFEWFYSASRNREPAA